MDKFLPQSMNDVSSNLMFILGVMVLTVAVNYWMLIPLSVAVAILLMFRTIYWRTSRSVKRLEGISK